jgi:hypothetical protein
MSETSCNTSSFTDTIEYVIFTNPGGIGRRKSVLKFVKNSNDFAGPPVEGGQGSLRRVVYY